MADIEFGIRITADGTAYINGVRASATETEKLSQAARNASSAMSATGDAGSKAAQGLKQSSAALTGFNGLLERGTSLILGFVSVYALIRGMEAWARMSDELTVLNTRLRGVTDSESELLAIQTRLRDTASGLQYNYATLARGFVEVAQSVRDLGGSAETAAKLVQIIATTAKEAGQSEEQASQQAQAFADALALGVQGGRAFTAILRENNDLARVLAEGLGVTTQELKRMAQSGEIDGQRMAEALISQFDKVMAHAQELPKTIAGGWTEVWNELQRAIGASSAGSAIADLEHRLAEKFRQAAKDDFSQLGRSLMAQLLDSMQGYLAGSGPRMQAMAAELTNQMQRSWQGKITTLEPMGPPESLFGGPNAAEAAAAQLNQLILSSQTVAGIQARFQQQRDLIITQFARLAQAAEDGGASYAAKFNAMIAALDRDEALALESLAKVGMPNIGAIFGNFDAQAALAVAGFETLATVTKDGLAREQSILDAAHAIGLVSEQDYIAQRGSIQQRGADAELAFIKSKYAEIAAELAKVQATPAQDVSGQEEKRKKIADLTAELVKLTTDWAVAENKVGDVARVTGDAIDQRNEKIRDALEQIRRDEEDYTRQVERRKDDWQFEISLIEKSTTEQAALRAEREAYLAVEDKVLQIQRQITDLSKTEADAITNREKIAALNAEIVNVRNTTGEVVAQFRLLAVAESEAYDRVQGFRDAWDAVSDTFRTFVDKATHSWSDAVQYMRDQLKNVLIKYLTDLALQRFVLPIFVSLTGAPGAAIAGGGAFSTLNAANSIFGGGNPLSGISNLFGGGGGGLFSSGLGYQFATSSVGSALGLSTVAPFIETIGATDAALGATIPTLTGFGSALGAAIPVVGAVVAGLSLFGGLFDKKPSPTRGQFTIQPTTTPSSFFEDQYSTASAFGNIGFTDTGTQYFSGQAAQAFNAIVSQALDQFQSRYTPEQSARLASILQSTAFPESTGGEQSTEAFIKQYGGQILRQVVTDAFDVLDTGLANVVRSFKGTDDEFSTFANTLLGIYDASKDFGDGIRDNILGALHDATQKGASDVLAFAQIIKTFAGTFAGLGSNVENLDAANIIPFIEALGGADKALNSFGYLAQNFTTSADNLVQQTSNLDAAFGRLGYAVPQTHEAFLTLLNGIDTTTESGRAAYASVLALSSSFVAIHGSAEQARQRIEQFANNFTTTGERQASALIALTKGFAELGLAVPRTHAEFLALYNSLTESSPAAAQSVLELSDAFMTLHGSADALEQTIQSAQDTFDQNFYTPEEQRARAAATGLMAIHDAEAALGITIPTTVAGFRQLIEVTAQTSGTNSELYRGLIQLAPAVLAVSGAAEDAATAIQRAYAALQYYIDAAQNQFVAVNQSIDAIVSASGGDFGSQMALRIRLIREQIAIYQRQYNEALAQGQYPLAQELYGFIQTLSYESATAAQSLARFAVLTKQYGPEIAAQLVQLENAYREQLNILQNAGLTAAIAALNANFQEQWDAIINGTSQGVDGTLTELQRLQQGLKEYLDRLRTGTLSPLTPQERYQIALQQFQAQLAAAQGGDLTAFGNLQSYFDTLLQSAAAQFGTASSQYQDIFNTYMAALQALTGNGPAGAGATQAQAYAASVRTATAVETIAANQPEWTAQFEPIVRVLPANSTLASADDMDRVVKRLEAKLDALMAQDREIAAETIEVEQEIATAQTRTITQKAGLAAALAA